ncbi:Aryl-hydrocarbon-interacting protein-like 1 [Lamellibrachia satsuma]|nr:Aryl-hydrocarbon-interacting protein-like 1 [Lamellibrachia satsuma]
MCIICPSNVSRGSGEMCNKRWRHSTESDNRSYFGPHSILGEFTTASENRKSKSIALIDLYDIIVNMTNVDVGNDCSIQKHVLHAGKGNIPSFINGTKVFFHYQTRCCDDNHTVMDDSRKHNKPMELYIGKKFKLEVWETCIKSMKVHEVASFKVHPTLLGAYPMVAKSLRDIHHGKHSSHNHCCGMTLKEHGLGYEDLDKLMKNPQPLEFILELLTVEIAGEFRKEIWAMDEGEKLAVLPKLREEGNSLYKEGAYEKAAAKYAEAIGVLEQLLLKEKPGDEDWTSLDKEKIPFLLNYSQCHLLLGNYYAVIEHTTEVITKDPGNVKALFRRARAHMAVWNPEDAMADLNRVLELDSSLERAVKKRTVNARTETKGKRFGR